MNIDGVFLHYLIDEVKPLIVDARINKFISISGSEFAFLLSNKYYLFVSLNSNSPHFRLTKNDLVKSNKTNPFLSALKKYGEGSKIIDINQNGNDRSAVITLNSFDELGYKTTIHFIIELYGRNSNFIITNENNEVIECFKRLLPNDDDLRILIPKSKYEYVKSLPNPYTDKVEMNAQMEGVSSLILNEIIYKNDLGVINTKVNPSLIKKDNKYYFYAFPLTHLEGEVTHFDTLSSLLEYYFYSIKHDTKLNDEQTLITNHLNKMIKRTKAKLEKQKQEKLQAIDNLKYEKIGNLLSSNLHKVTKGVTSIEVNDFYNNGALVKITINPELTPAKNLNQYYQKYKKAKRSLEVIDDQINQSEKEIDYYNQILEQVEIGKSSDLAEVITELNIKGQKTKKKVTTPNIAKYTDSDGNCIFVGKNNIQNNYLTHTLAHSNDYFFHVTSYSGSHTILRCQELTDRLIHLASMIALMYSKSREGVNVAVDYTLVKYVKKVPGTFGSFVTYTNQKTTYATVDLNEINKELTRIK